MLLRSAVEHYIEECPVDLAWGIIDEDLEVKIGFQTGTGCKQEGGIWHGEWHSAYIYCRRFVEDNDPGHNDWAWRVVIYHA